MMSEKTKVSVKIYGQEYKISGDAPREYIIQLADYVDGKIVEVATNMKQYTMPMITVLAAVNIADEYYKARKKVNDLQTEMNRQTIEMKNKNHFLEKAKGSYIQFKEEAEKARRQISTMENELDEKNNKYDDLTKDFEELKNKNTDEERENKKLLDMVAELKEELLHKNNEIEELKQINQELENNYFDTQMLNVQLKKEIEDMTKEKAE